MKKFTLVAVILNLLLLTACEETRRETSEEMSSSDSSSISSSNNQSAGDTLYSGSLKIYPLEDSPAFGDAILNLNSPSEKANIKENSVHFSYDIKNYSLAQPTTEGCCATECANSAQGQHIHLILNNEPYLARYTPEFDEKLENGHYVALSFLSRSYHESIKHYDAYDLRQFTVGNVTEKEIDLTQPMLFYSRPKGEYKINEAQKLLLDFYVVNAALGVNEYSVRATIDGHTFSLNKWTGYLIEGLSEGEHKIKIELLDKNGDLVKSRYAESERSILIKADVN